MGSHDGASGRRYCDRGTGVTDAVTGVANAFMDSIPIILIGGRSPLADDDKLPLQAVDQMGILRPITKWARSITHTERIPEYLAAAFRHATTGRPGPVSWNCRLTCCSHASMRSESSFRKIGSRSARSQQSRAGAGAQMAARGQAPCDPSRRRSMVRAGGCGTQRFAELSNTPVMTNSKARGSISEEHPLCFGGFGAIHPAIHAKSGGSADLVIMLGKRIGMFTGGRNSVIPGDARVIQVDIEPEEIGRNRNIELGIVSDCGEFLRQAREAAKGAKFDHHAGMGRAAERGAQCDASSL